MVDNADWLDWYRTDQGTDPLGPAQERFSAFDQESTTLIRQISSSVGRREVLRFALDCLGPFELASGFGRRTS